MQIGSNCSYICDNSDFVAGGELFGLMNMEQNWNGLKIAQVRLWSAQIVSALETMHNLHIIYRDLKMENLLIDTYGNIVLADFGMSRFLEPPDYKVKDYGGTLPYMAPGELFSLWKIS